MDVTEYKTIAVYGTLKSDKGNRSVMRGTLIGKGLTKEKYAMFASGIPYLAKNIPQTNITVELYKVPVDEVKYLDRFEGHPTFYERTPIKVLCNEEEVDADIYFTKDFEKFKSVDEVQYYTQIRNISDGIF